MVDPKRDTDFVARQPGQQTRQISAILTPVHQSTLSLLNNPCCLVLSFRNAPALRSAVYKALFKVPGKDTLGSLESARARNAQYDLPVDTCLLITCRAFYRKALPFSCASRIFRYSAAECDNMLRHPAAFESASTVGAHLFQQGTWHRLVDTPARHHFFRQFSTLHHLRGFCAADEQWVQGRSVIDNQSCGWRRLRAQLCR